MSGLKGLIILLVIPKPIVYAKPLENLIQQAVSTHPSVQSGQAHIEVSEAEIDTARWQFFPTA